MSTKGDGGWETVNVYGIAQYDFEPKGKFQIALKKKHKYEVHKKSPKGWYKGADSETPTQKGIFPISYVKLTEEKVIPAASVKLKAAATRKATVTEKKKPPPLASTVKKQPPARTTATPAAATAPAAAAAAVVVKKVPPPPAAKKKQPPPAPAAATTTAAATAATAAAGNKRERMESNGMAAATDNTDDEALVNELHDCISQWETVQAALLSNNTENSADEYHKQQEGMCRMLALRGQLLDRDNKSEKTSTRETVVQMIESNRKMQEGYMVVRNSKGEVADAQSTPLVDLLAAHRAVYEKLQFDKVAANLEEKVVSGGGNNGSARMPYSLHLDVQMCIFSVGEDTELFFSLYNAERKMFISEDFHLSITAAGMPGNLRLLGRMKTLFAELKDKDFNNLWLVCKIYRKGRLVFDPKKKKPPSVLFKRPFGCAAMDLTSLGLMDKMRQEITPPNSAMMIYYTQSEHNFPKLHEMIIAKDKNLLPAPRAKGIALTLALFQGKISDLRAEEAKRLNAEECPLTKKLEFQPSKTHIKDKRNDIYITFLGGHFNRGKKSAAMNIEFTARILMDDGTEVKDCIYTGQSGFDDEDALSSFKSGVYYHSDNPVYDEQIRLNIDPKVVERCHLLVTFTHVSTSITKKTSIFSYCYKRLTSTATGCITDNGVDTLVTYWPFNKLKGSHSAPYLKEKDEAKLKPRKESFNIRIQLLSTIKTQNRIIHPLIHWQTAPAATIKKQLAQFRALNNTDELATYVRELMNALFGMINSNVAPFADMHADCFRAMLKILELLSDKKLIHYRPLVDDYIDTVFDFKISVVLLKLANERLKSAVESPNMYTRSLCKTLTYLLKVIVTARSLEQKAGLDTEADFKAGIRTMLGSVNQLVSLSSQKAMIFQSQTYLIREYPTFMTVLQDLFDPAELGAITKDFLSHISSDSKQAMSKLNLVRFLLKTDVITNKASRDILLPQLIQVITTHLSAIQTSKSLAEPYLALNIFKNVVQIIQSSSDPAQLSEFHDMLPAMIEFTNTLQLYHRGEISLSSPTDSTRQSCAVDLLIDPHTIFFIVFKSASQAQIDHLIDSLGSAEARFKFISTIFTVCNVSLQINVYPDMWIAMHMLHLDAIEHVVETMQSHVISKFTKDQEFSFPLWEKFMVLCFTLVLNDHLHLESFSPSKIDFIKTKYGDVRLKVVQHLRDLWFALGARQRTRFNSLIIPYLFKLLPVANTAIKSFCMEIYFDALCVEYRSTQSFGQVERFTIDELYEVSNRSQSEGKAFVLLLESTLTSRFQSEADLKDAGSRFLEHLATMYGLMSSFVNFPHTALYEDERTSVALRLIKYLEQSGHVREEMQTRYIQYLVDLHESLGNFIEAGVTQLSQITLLKWSKTPTAAYGSFPAECQAERKERLYRSAINFFVQANSYEHAVKMCEQLRIYYQTLSFDYGKVSSVMSEMSKYYGIIATLEQFYPSYFRVVYHGNFEEEIKGKEFVYRGSPLEPVMDFTNRIKQKFPDAKILMSSDAPKDSMREEFKQIISITTLTLPSHAKRKALLDWFQEKGHKITGEEVAAVSLNSDMMPKNLALHAQNDLVRVFEYSKGVNKSKEKKPANEHKDLWVKKTFVFTEQSFPTNRRRLAVIEAKEIMITPVENAVITVLDKTRELSEKIDSVAKLPDDAKNVDVGPLSMNLNGILDAAVMGGAKKYIEAFLPAANGDVRPMWRNIWQTEVEVRIFPTPGSEVLAVLKPMETFQQLQIRGDWIRFDKGWTRLHQGENVYCECTDQGDSKDDDVTEEEMFRIDLKDALREQIIMVNRGLDVFKVRAPANLGPLLEHLIGMYKKMVAFLNPVIES